MNAFCRNVCHSRILFLYPQMLCTADSYVLAGIGELGSEKYPLGLVNLNETGFLV